MTSNGGIVAVTGAAGHVGVNLVEQLIARGRRVRLLVNEDRRAIEALDAEKVSGNVLDPGSLRAAFAGVEVVYHAAAKVSIESGDEEVVGRVNVEGVRNVMQACLESGVRRVVHFSSIHAFEQEPVTVPLDETRGPPGPDAPPYNHSKVAGEREVAAAVKKGLDVVIVNPTAVLGPGDFRISPMGEVLLQLARRELPALVNGGFDWVDVRDVVAGAMGAEEHGRTGERYLLSGSWTPIADLARMVEKLTGARPPMFTSQMWLARAGAPFVERFFKLVGKRPLYTHASLHALRSNRLVSHEKAVRELGYSVRPLAQTIRDTIAWHREHGNLPRA